MRKTAALISLFVALVLFGTALSGVSRDANSVVGDLDKSFDSLERKDYAELHRMNAEAEARKNEQAIEAVAGAAFLVAAVALWSTSGRLSATKQTA